MNIRPPICSHQEMMDDSCSTYTPQLQSGLVSNIDKDDLSDKQLRQLLKSAESRLRVTLDKSSDHTDAHIPPAAQKSLLAGSAGDLPSSYIHFANQHAQLHAASHVAATELYLVNEIRGLDEPCLVRSSISKSKVETAGADWYDMPRTNLTRELKRDIQILHMRSVLNPKRHYKKQNVKNQIPQFSVTGTVIEGPTEFFNARLTKQERKRTLVEEVLAGQTAMDRFKSKYTAIQFARKSGKKSHYKSMRAKRTQKTPNS